MSPRRSVLVAFLWASLLLTGCKEKFTPQIGPEIDPGPPLRVLPTIRVLNQGLSPYQPMRYKAAPGQTEQLSLELVRMRAARSSSGQTAGAIPPVQLEVQIGPAERTPEGWVRQPVRVTRVRLSTLAEQLPPVERERIEKELAPLLNVRGWTDLDAQGRIRRSKSQAIQDVNPRIRAMLGNIRTALVSVPFPEQPIGVRARWEVERDLEISGVSGRQTVTYELMERQDDELKLTITARQSAPPQSIGSGRLEAYEASVIGSALVRLRHFVPFSEAESNAQMRLSGNSGGQPELIRVQTETAVRVYPSEAGAMFESPPTQDATGDGPPAPEAGGRGSDEAPQRTAP